jgi:hypothetical protein
LLQEKEQRFGRRLLEAFLITMKNKYLAAILLIVSCYVKLFSQQNHFVLFINGYRGVNLDHYTADGSIIDPRKPKTTHVDSSFKSEAWIIGYWKPNQLHFDDSILIRYENAYPIYIDGHHPLKTSAHKNKNALVWSYVKSKIYFFRRSPKGVLNLKSNKDGFNQRMIFGKKVGNDFNTHYLTDINQPKITIVCHSMGFAVALGLVQSLDKKVQFKDFVIISPEGTENGYCNWEQFRSVWHFSPSWKNGRYRIVANQDGIAPQVPIVGMKNTQTTGLIGVPMNSKKVSLGFYKSHHMAYFHWFFDIKKGDRGYFGDY